MNPCYYLEKKTIEWGFYFENILFAIDCDRESYSENVYKLIKKGIKLNETACKGIVNIKNMQSCLENLI